jgi:hypothetical protein
VRWSITEMMTDGWLPVRGIHPGQISAIERGALHIELSGDALDKRYAPSGLGQRTLEMRPSALVNPLEHSQGNLRVQDADTPRQVVRAKGVDRGAGHRS